jgi:glycine/D-amino acid oxidase-like deaminating enzyme
MEARVIVVGGGVMGVSIAWHAAIRSDPIEGPVVLLERRELAAGSSGRSGAILRQFYSQREVAGMARDSLSVYAGFERRTGRRIGFQQPGVLTIVGPDDRDGLALAERNVAMMRGIGIDVRFLDAAGIRRLSPAIAVRDGTVAAHEPGGAAVDPVATVEAFAALARERGAITRLGSGATGFLVEGGRVVGVDTEHGPIRVGREGVVVVAAGPWTGKLLRGIDVDLPLRVVRPEQHFVEALSSPRPLTHARVVGEGDREPAVAPVDRLLRSHAELDPAPHPIFLDLEHGVYTRVEMHPSPLGFATPRTRIGSMDLARDAEVEDPDRVDEEVGSEFRSWARSKLVSRMPDYAERADVGSMVGMYTMTPDSQAVIGPVPGTPGLIIVSGFSGHGFKLAPSIGEGVAQLIAGDPVSAFDPEFFSLGRFGRQPASPGSNDRGPDQGRGFGL